GPALLSPEPGRPALALRRQPLLKIRAGPYLAMHLLEVLASERAMQAGRPPHEGLHGTHREGRVLHDLTRERRDRAVELVSRNDPVDQPESDRPPGGHRLTCEEKLVGLCGTDGVDELPGERHRYRETDARERHRETRRVGRDAQVAVQRQLAAAGDRIA